MKRLLLILSILVLSVIVMAQAPQQFSYQALIRDAENEIVSNRVITLQVSIITTNDDVVYSETHQTATNENGVVSVAVGSGSTTDDFSQIDWSIGDYYMQTTIDLGAGEQLVSGNSPLLSVPYAFYAEKAGNAVEVDLSEYALKSDIPAEVDLTDYAKKSDIPEAVDLSDYALKSEIPAEVDLTDYAKKSDIPEAVDLSGYYSKTEIDALLTALESRIGSGSITADVPELTGTVTNDITVNAVTFSSTVIGAKGYILQEVGFCIGTLQNPTIDNNAIRITIDQNSLGEFSDRIVGLQPNTTYHVRSYATNAKGTGYGTDIQFQTLSDETFDYATGAIHSYFSIDESNKVSFSQGNLQYQASTKTWRFAENQWDYVGTQTPDGNGYAGGTVEGSDNALISSSYNGWIDLFGWGTSGYKGKNPYMTSGTCSDYSNNGVNSDWGVYNKISNGGNTEGMWRTLAGTEWRYILSTRKDANLLIGKATVNDVVGLVLLPDNWTLPDGITFISGMQGIYAQNIYSIADWKTMENNGAVFLPAAGYRYTTKVSEAGFNGQYWSISTNLQNATTLEFDDSDGMDSNTVERGLSVRLVKNVIE